MAVEIAFQGIRSAGAALIDHHDVVVGADGLEEGVAGSGFGDGFARAASECENWLGFFWLEGWEDDYVQADFAAGLAVAIFPDRICGAEGTFRYAGDGAGVGLCFNCGDGGAICGG
jgi:hypothetical protein